MGIKVEVAYSGETENSAPRPSEEAIKQMISQEIQTFDFDEIMNDNCYIEGILFDINKRHLMETMKNEKVPSFSLEFIHEEDQKIVIGFLRFPEKSENFSTERFYNISVPFYFKLNKWTPDISRKTISLEISLIHTMNEALKNFIQEFLTHAYGSPLTMEEGRNNIGELLYDEGKNFKIFYERFVMKSYQDEFNL